MKAIFLLKRVRQRRGQTMVLGVLGVMLVALMMLITLNVGKAVYEKIRIQQLADSEAFSTATLEARSFNFFAYTNRANIAGLVAAASAHGYMSLASTVPGMFKAAAGGFFIMAGIEFALCCACPYCSCVQHCIHGIRDLLTAFDYLDRGDELADDVQDLDKAFIDVMKALDLHVKAIAAQQQAMRGWVELVMLTPNKVANDLKDKYSEGSDNLMHIGLLNAYQYNKVFDTEEKHRKWLGTEISNGTRHTDFVTDRNLMTVYLGVFPTTLKELMYDIPRRYTNGFTMIVWHEGESRTVKDGTGVRDKIASGSHGPDGKASAGADEGYLITQAYCAVGFGEYDARVGTDHDSGEHKCHADWISYDCCDDESKHEDAFKCLGDGGLLIHNCFMVFNSDPDESNDFGQPRVYAALDSDLRRTRGQGGKIAWEVTDNDSGTVSMDFGDVHNKVQQEMGGPGRKVQISANPDAAWGPEGDSESLGKGVAASKALAYYHHPEWSDNQSGWKEAPNFFNPYWKAKLQPFRNTTELAEALGTYSMKYGAILLGGLLAEPPLP